MKPSLHSLLFLLACAAFGPPSIALAQTPTLEFTVGTGNPAGNPTTNGPSIADQVITFQNNVNNPTGTTFAAYTPTTQATFSLSNQQYTGQSYAPGTGIAFGSTIVANNNSSTTGSAIFPLMNSIGFNNIATATANGYFTSASGVNGGIDVTVNNAVELFVSTLALPTNVPANQRYQYADLTISFNRSVANPVIQLVGMGGFYGNNGFSAELDLLTPGVTLSKLNGSGELIVNSTGGINNLGQINNGTANPSTTTGAGAASGSVLVTTPSTGISTLSFRVYLRPLPAGGQLHADNGQAGDVWLIGLSSLAAVPPITGYVYEDVNYGGGAGRPRSTTGTVVRPNARVELYNSAGTFVSTVNTDANGLYTFNPGVGNYTVRVVNSSVTSSRTGAVAVLLPVQTYNGTTTQVGGQAPEKVDAGNGAAGTTLASLNTATTIAESQAAVTVAVGTTATGADFGYNFDTVVNTNNTGQGSLRQF
ncbi:MAG: hypothetical protein EOO60_09885, partial [Hymenobacter sp.]